ncbi:MAG: DUF1697 domain-containing protein [Candidatus Levyibacteriota bacterium]
MKYVAFLRGINVGGNKKVPMEELRKTFSEWGFSEVKTLLNSGNVVFDAEEKESKKLKEAVELGLEKTFGWRIEVFLRTQESLQKMVNENPFAKIEVTPQTRLYVTFLPKNMQTTLEIPYKSENNLFRILDVKDDTLFSVLTISQDGDSLKLMNVIGKEFGKNVTTRNWNTIKKVAAL